MCPSHFGPNHFFACGDDLSVACRADVERRATGVDDEDVEIVGQWLDRGVREPRYRRECRAGVDAVERLLTHLVESHDAARQVGREQRLATETELTETIVDLVQVRAHQRLERHVDGGGRRPSVLTDDGVERVTQRDLDVGERGTEHLADAQLVHRVHDRPQQAHTHCLDAELLQPRQHPLHARFVERCADGAVGEDALVHRERERPWHVRLGVGDRDVERVGLPALSVEEDVAVTDGRDERGAGSAADEHRVGGRRRRVDERLGVAQELLDRQPVVGRREPQRLVHALEHVRGCRRRLVQAEDPLGVGEDEVAERSSGVDGDREPHGQPPLCRSLERNCGR